MPRTDLFTPNTFTIIAAGSFGENLSFWIDDDISVGGSGVQRGTPVTFTGGLAQANYWLFPWVIGIMRYDVVNSPTDFLNGASRHNTRNRFSPGIQILVRGNIKALLEYQRRWQQSAGADGVFFRANGLVAGIDFVF